MLLFWGVKKFSRFSVISLSVSPSFSIVVLEYLKCITYSICSLSIVIVFLVFRFSVFIFILIFPTSSLRILQLYRYRIVGKHKFRHLFLWFSSFSIIEIWFLLLFPLLFHRSLLQMAGLKLQRCFKFSSSSLCFPTIFSVLSYINFVNFVKRVMRCVTFVMFLSFFAFI